MSSTHHQLTGITFHRTRSFVILRFTIIRYDTTGPQPVKVEEHDEYVVRSWNGLWRTAPFDSLGAAQAAIDALLELARQGPLKLDAVAWTDDEELIKAAWGTQDDSDLAHVVAALNHLLVDPDEVHVSRLGL